MKSELGRIVATAEVADCMRENADFTTFVWACMERYRQCDWGDLYEEDAKQNDDAVESGDDRMMASYPHPTNPDWKIWIITEWDRSVTTILFPSEY